MEYNYSCEHDHRNGHVMRLSWNGVIELVVDITNGMAGVLVRGEVKDTYSVEGMLISEFMEKIAECQQMYDKMKSFQ